MTDVPEDLLALENQVCFGLAVAARSVIALYRPVLEPLNLTHPQYLVMLALWEREPRSVKDLSDALQLEPATLSPLLKRLEAEGLLQRHRRAEDERTVQLTLTARGRELRGKAAAIQARVQETTGLAPAALAALREDLHALAARLRAAHLVPEPV